MRIRKEKRTGWHYAYLHESGGVMIVWSMSPKQARRIVIELFDSNVIFQSKRNEIHITPSSISKECRNAVDILMRSGAELFEARKEKRA